MAAVVAASSVMPATEHFSWVAAQAKYVANAAPHFGSARKLSHCATSLDAGAGLFGHEPFDAQLGVVPELDPEHARSPKSTPASVRAAIFAEERLGRGWRIGLRECARCGQRAKGSGAPRVVLRGP
jgi:hypothetical protein